MLYRRRSICLNEFASTVFAFWAKKWQRPFSRRAREKVLKTFDWRSRKLTQISTDSIELSNARVILVALSTNHNKRLSTQRYHKSLPREFETIYSVAYEVMNFTSSYNKSKSVNTLHSITFLRIIKSRQFDIGCVYIRPIF